MGGAGLSLAFSEQGIIQVEEAYVQRSGYHRFTIKRVFARRDFFSILMGGG
jgi:hypothetical protein